MRRLSGIMNKIIKLFFASLFLFSCVTNQTVPNGTVVQPLVQPNGGWSAAYSPDGGMIAFLSSTLHTPSDIWVMKPDGTGAGRLTTLGADSFSWSADGKKIIFVARRRGFEEVFSVTLNGEEKKISGLPLGSGMPVYSPNGELFALTAPGENKNVKDLWIGTADGKRIEPVTEKLGIRNIFWGPDSRRIYYEVGGKGYGVGVWEMDLATMESKAVLNNYIGSPRYSKKTGLIAYAYPTDPGEFEVHTMKPDGSDIKIYKSPRLLGKWLVWDFDGKGVYYLGQDIKEIKKEGSAEQSRKKDEKIYGQHKSLKPKEVERAGVTSLWHLDFETSAEKRISSENIHLSDASLSPDGKRILLSGAIEKSYSSEIFSLDLSSGEMVRLAGSRASSWLAVPNIDASKIAFFTNEGSIDTLKIIDSKGRELASHPGAIQEPDTRLFWLPKSEGLVFFSGRGVFAFTEKENVRFKKTPELRAYLHADVSIQDDKIMVSAVPLYGINAGLYQLEVSGGTLILKDFRFPAVQEEPVPDVYLQPKWSFDGTRIAFSDAVDVWTMKSDNTGRSHITRYLEANEKKKGKLPLASYPVWSVDGTMICYTLTIYEGETSTRQIWVMKADGSDQKMLHSEEVKSKFQVFMPEYTNQPFFDAEGKHVIFTAVQNGLPNLFRVNVKGGKVLRLTDTGAIFPVLLPEEGVIYYTALEGNSETLWVMNSDGTEKHRLEIKSPENKAASVLPETEGVKKNEPEGAR